MTNSIWQHQVGQSWWDTNPSSVPLATPGCSILVAHELHWPILLAAPGCSILVVHEPKWPILLAAPGCPILVVHEPPMINSNWQHQVAQSWWYTNPNDQFHMAMQICFTLVANEPPNDQFHLAALCCTMLVVHEPNQCARSHTMKLKVPRTECLACVCKCCALMGAKPKQAARLYEICTEVGGAQAGAGAPERVSRAYSRCHALNPKP